MNSAFSLVQPGVLTVGVDAAAPLPLHTDPAQPPLTGFDIDLTQQLAQRLGLAVTYRSALWRGIMQELEEGATDLICSAATITEDRKQQLDFSNPYLDISLALVVRQGSEITGVGQLAQKTLGVRVATSAETFIREQVGAATVVTFDLNTEAYQALQSGQVDAVIDDSPIAGYFAKSLHLRAAEAIAGTEAQYGLLFRKGNTALRQAVNKALAEIRADGTYETIRQAWLDSPACQP
jgi:polar amino acid transport system substrate-binding protein